MWKRRKKEEDFYFSIEELLGRGLRKINDEKGILDILERRIGRKRKIEGKIWIKLEVRKDEKKVIGEENKEGRIKRIEVKKRIGIKIEWIDRGMNKEERKKVEDIWEDVGEEKIRKKEVDWNMEELKEIDREERKRIMKIEEEKKGIEGERKDKEEEEIEWIERKWIVKKIVEFNIYV